MIGWSPYAIFALIKQYGNKDLISPAMAVVPSIFAKVTIIYNPIIYVGLNTQFRQAFFRIIGGTVAVSRTTTVSTTANLMDSEAREIVKNKLRAALVNDMPTSADSVGAIEMNDLGERKRKDKTVKIKLEENTV